MKRQAMKEIEDIRQVLESDIKQKMDEVSEAMMNQNRFMSDLRVTQCEIENYMEKYLPYNC